MTRFPASSRASSARPEDMTLLEYGLVTAFVLMAVIAAVPAAFAAAARSFLA